MDQSTQERLDALLEEEIRRGYRVKAVPQELRAQIKGEGLPDMAFVRFSRLNPRRRAKISEAVQRRYHADLKNADILSNDQIAKLTEERGEWTTVQSARMLELVDETQRLQSELYVEGLSDQNWHAELQETARLLRAEIEKTEYVDPAEQATVLTVLARWVDYTPARRDLYTEQFAKEQELDVYSPDRDLQWLLDRVPSTDAADALQLIDDLRDRVLRYIDMQMKRTELAQLQNRHARIFADSVESRRDQAEEMARVYFCSERVDETEKALGPIAETFDALWDFPEDLIQWLIIEHYFFANGLPDAARDYLETFGFLKADREKTEETTTADGASTPSVESPDPQSSKADLPLAAATGASSSTSPVPTI